MSLPVQTKLGGGAHVYVHSGGCLRYINVNYAALPAVMHAARCCPLLCVHGELHFLVFPV